VEENRLGKREKSTLTHIDMDMAKPMNMYKNIRMRQFEQHCSKANIFLRNEHATLTWLKVKLRKVKVMMENTKISARKGGESGVV